MEFKEVFPFPPENYNVLNAPRDVEDLYHNFAEANIVLHKEERRLMKALRRYLADTTGIKPKKLY